jgi:hypothetical protein
LMRWEMFDILEEDEEAASPLSSSPAPIITSPGKQNRKNSLLKGGSYEISTSTSLHETST